MIDLHSHSTASDGELTPSGLVDAAIRAGLSALALTDHDSVAGVAEARARAAERGLRLVAGVEIEIAFEPGEFHLLGLGVNDLDPALRDALDRLAEARRDRNRNIVDLMRSAGIAADYDEIVRSAGTPHLGRPHLADHLVRARAARTRQDAFDRYLGKGRPLYLPKECLEFDEALRLIHDAGGAAIVAHPYSLFVSKTRLADLMDEWKERGVEGIEAYHPTAKLGQCRILERMARERGFAITAGSDWHGPGRPECGLGRSAGGIEVPAAYLEDLDLRLGRRL